MDAKFAFTAQFWGDGAVVCRAVEDRPGPVVDQQFGEFKTWTQAQAFAAKLNEGLDLVPLEARQIVTSSLLATACVVQEALYSTSYSSWKGSPVEAAARAAQLRCILAEQALALTLCRSAAYLSESGVDRIVSNVRKVIHQSAHFLKFFDADHNALQDIASRAQELNSTLEHMVSCLPCGEAPGNLHEAGVPACDSCALLSAPAPSSSLPRTQGCDPL